MSPRRYAAQLLFRPEDAALKFLPEGPYACGDGLLSWVAIQHGREATRGSLNILDIASRRNRSYPLEGRPGFAFPTSRPDVFLIGCEKQVGFYDLRSGRWSGPSVAVEEDVEGTIINDGLVHGDVVIFGTKDLAFAEPKAGLYFWRPSRNQLVRLADGQTCSNGKVVLGEGDRVRLLDIDTPTRRVVEYFLDLRRASVGRARTILDLTDTPAYPDGMILTPDASGVVVALYAADGMGPGEARQYELASGAVRAVWTTEGSPQVTCPQWLRHGSRVRLVLTTAVERMTPERQAACPNAGALFIADTPWVDGPTVHRFPLP